MRWISYAAFALVVSAACQPAPTEMTEQEISEVAAQVNAINDGFWNAWRDADIERGVSYYYDSPEFTFAIEGELLVGFSEVQEVTRSTYANIASQSITVAESYTTVLSPDLVYLVDRASYAVTDTDGVTGPDTQFVFTALWRNTDGEWKVHHAHLSNPPPQ